MSRHIKILDRQFIPAGTVVIEQGTLGNRAFMIESGSVEVFMIDPHGKELILAELGIGALVGEMAAMSEGLRSASVRAKGDCVLVTISAHDLQESLKASNNLYKRMMRMMTERMRDTNVKLMQKERELAAVTQASHAALQSVALNVAAKHEKLQNEITPLLDAIKGSAEKFQFSDFKRD